MKLSRLCLGRLALLLLISVLPLQLPGQTSEPTHPRAAKPRVSVAKIGYHGWAHSYVLTNGTVEVVVVPDVGRVMHILQSLSQNVDATKMSGLVQPLEAVGTAQKRKLEQQRDDAESKR